MFSVSYDYYRDSYGGKLDEDIFNSHLMSACSYVDMYTFGRVSADDVPVSVKNTVCFIVEFINSNPDTRVISDESVGSQSVSYDSNFNRSYEDRIYGIVRRYLSNTNLLYRGV